MVSINKKVFIGVLSYSINQINGYKIKMVERRLI